MEPKANALLEKFIYSCSHDLKSPISSIQGLVRLADYYPHHDEIGKCLELIEACTHKMDNLIRKLEEFLSNSQREAKMAPIDVTELIGTLARQFEKQLDAYHIAFTSEVNSPVDWIMDKEIIRKVMQYLIANSIAYHDPARSDRTIAIRVVVGKTGTLVEVKDNGMGISTDQVGKVFDIFTKASEDSIGEGMGLFLASSLVEKVGGMISCRSEKGKGTCIAIAFPLQSLD